MFWLPRAVWAMLWTVHAAGACLVHQLHELRPERGIVPGVAMGRRCRRCPGGVVAVHHLADQPAARMALLQRLRGDPAAPAQAVRPLSLHPAQPALSFQAAYTGPIVMMSQNRQSA